MKLIAHRGFWLQSEEKNSMKAFSRALEAGFGIETDFRDLNGELVLSHDPPHEGAVSATAFFELVHSFPKGLIAVNVKADGLQSTLVAAVSGLPMDRVFVFDMSVPDTLGYFESSTPVFVRASEYENPCPALLSKASGVWLDAFHGDWFTRRTIEAYRTLGLSVCIVSPELHQRKHDALWGKLKEWGFAADPAIFLCTDFPDQAEAFFL